MCEFCVQHGDGQKWYLAMQNYSQELLLQDNRIEYIKYFVNTFEQRMPPKLAQMDRLFGTPLGRWAKPFLTHSQKRDHFGQIVPIEDLEQILVQVNGIYRLSCPCRRVTAGQKNARYCFALTANAQIAAEIDASYNLEALTSAEAVASIRLFDEQGLYHSVWTFKTPFIGAVCNCDPDCIPHRVSCTGRYYPMMFRGEYVARVNPDLCNGCRNCMRQCHFGAARYSATLQKVSIDVRRCFGCGVCRATCPNHAVALQARNADPVAARIWS